MKKKYLVLFVLSFIVLLFSVVSYLLRDRVTVTDLFWKWIDIAMDESRRKDVGDEYGEYTRVGSRFCINHYKTGKCFEYNEHPLSMDGSIFVLLEQVYGFRAVDNVLYVKSKNGCAVIDENNHCRIYQKGSAENAGVRYVFDNYGTKRFYGIHLIRPEIEYLDSYELFTKEEREMFEKWIWW